MQASEFSLVYICWSYQMGTLLKDSRVTADAASRKFAYWEILYRQNDWWGFQFFSRVSSLTMKTLLPVELAWWGLISTVKGGAEGMGGQKYVTGVGSAQGSGIQAAPLQCQWSPLLCPLVPWRLTASWPWLSQQKQLHCINDLREGFLSWLTATWEKKNHPGAMKLHHCQREA